MPSVEVAVPEELLALLKRTRLGDREVAEQVRVALAIHLFQEGVASIAGEPRATFEQLLAELGIPAMRYDLRDYEEDLAAYDRARRA
jgi:predicted HTH domain antitoxin